MKSESIEKVKERILVLLDKMDDIDRIDNVELMINIRAFLEDYEKSVKVLMKERNNKWER